MSRGYRENWVGKFVVSRIIGFAFKTIIVLWLWNHLAPDIFGLHRINLVQAFGLLILTRLLTGNFSSHHKSRMSMSKGRHMLERWRNMNEEERQQWMEGKDRWKHMKE